MHWTRKARLVLAFPRTKVGLARRRVSPFVPWTWWHDAPNLVWEHLMDETERRRLVVLNMKLKLRDSRDPLLAQKDAAAQRKRDTPEAQEATREVLRQHARSVEDADKG